MEVKVFSRFEGEFFSLFLLVGRVVEIKEKTRISTKTYCFESHAQHPCHEERDFDKTKTKVLKTEPGIKSDKLLVQRFNGSTSLTWVQQVYD